MAAGNVDDTNNQKYYDAVNWPADPRPVDAMAAVGKVCDGMCVPAGTDRVLKPERAPTACCLATEAMFTVNIHALSGEEHAIAVTRGTPLRDVQAQICRQFKKQWPATKADLAEGEHVFDEFIHKPFANCSGGETLLVIFSRTDDPHHN